MYYTKADFMQMTEEQLVSIWENGVYLNPDEMDAYIRVCEYREIELY